MPASAAPARLRERRFFHPRPPAHHLPDPQRHLRTAHRPLHPRPVRGPQLETAENRSHRRRGLVYRRVPITNSAIEPPRGPFAICPSSLPPLRIYRADARGRFFAVPAARTRAIRAYPENLRVVAQPLRRLGAVAKNSRLESRHAPTLDVVPHP